MEVDLVWKSKWGFVKALYFLQRYLPFIDTAWLTLYGQFGTFLIFLRSSFSAQTKAGLTKTACQKIHPSSAGSYSTFDLGFNNMRCIFLPVLTAIGFSASDSRPDFHSLFCAIVLIDK